MKKRIAFLLVLLATFTWWWSAYAADTPNLVLPEELKNIEQRAFYGTKSIQEVTLPEGAKKIYEEAFAYSSLTSINLPDSLIYIADNAFVGCNEIRMTVAPDSYAYDWAIRKGYIHCAPEWEAHRIDYSDGELALTLTWPYAEAARYDVYRSEDGDSNMQLVGSSKPEGTGSQGYVDKTVEPGKSYVYRLRLVTEKANQICEEGFNTPLQIDTKDVYAGKVSGFTMDGALENISVYSKYAWKVESVPSWLKVSQTSGQPGKTTVQVYGKLNNTGEDRTGYVYFSSGKSLCSQRIDQIGVSFGLLNFKATADSSEARIDIEWSANSAATGYLIYRSHKAETGFIQIAETADTSYSDTSVSYGSTYYYKVLEYADEFDGTRTVGYDDGTAVCASTISQIAVPTSIKLTCANSLVDMWIGDVDTLEATIEPSQVDNDTVIWETSDEAVADVTDEGKVYALGVGSATITATTANGLSAEYEVSVIRGYPQPNAQAEGIGCVTVRIYWDAMDGVDSYNVYDTNSRLLGSTTDTQYITSNGAPGMQAKYYVEAVYEDGEKSSMDSAKAVCWTTPGKAQVTVKETTAGYVTLAWTAPATADHYYVARSTTSDMTYPDVWEKVLTTSYTDADVTPGMTYYYQVDACVWDGVSKTGDLITVTVPSDGTTVIPTGIRLDHTDMSINSDVRTLQLTASVLPGNATDKKVTWISSDESIATVAGNGVVTIADQASGTVTITARTRNGYTAACRISINEDAEDTPQYGSGIYVADFSGGFDEENYTLTVGDTLQMTGSVNVPAGIGRVTVKVDGYQPDGTDGENRYASATFGDATSIDLADYSVFTIDGDSLPFNVPGLYTMKLWASDDDGNYTCLDSAKVQVKASASQAVPTIYVTIGSDTRMYRDGDHLGVVYNNTKNTLWIDAHFTNTLRAWYRIECPDHSGGTEYVHSNAYNVADIYDPDADAYSWYRDIPAGADPGIYEIKIDAVNSSIENDQDAPRATLTLTIEVRDSDENLGSKFSRIRSLFPHNMYWCHTPGTEFDAYTISNTECVCGYRHGKSRPGSGSHPRLDGSCGCNTYGGIQCWGYANIVSKELFGTRAVDAYGNPQAGWTKYSGAGYLSDVQAGDVIRIKPGHSAVVLSVDNTYIYVTDCNWSENCRISWSRKFTKAKMQAGGSYELLWVARHSSME